MKKLVSLILSLVMITAIAATFTGCSDSKEGKVMTIDLNPSVEFVLDENNKVVTVNALNDEGNYVLAKAEFIGKDAEEAVQAFLKVSVDDGFIVEGEVTAGENNVKISVSGEDAQKIYDDVTAKAKEYLQKLPSVNVNVNFDFEKINKEEIEALVADCMRELDPQTIKAKTQAELIALLEQSRKATKDLLSQELKDYYYGERALEIKKVQLEAYIEAIKNEDNIGLVSATLTAVQGQLNNLIEMINSYKETYKQKFLDKSGEYYQKMQQCIKDKKELLTARLNGVSEEAIAALENAYQITVKALQDYKAIIDQQLEVANTAINQIIDTIQTAIQTITETLNITVKNIDGIVNESIEAAKKNFDNAFKTENGEYISDNYWTALEPEKTK